MLPLTISMVHPTTTSFYKAPTDDIPAGLNLKDFLDTRQGFGGGSSDYDVLEIEKQLEVIKESFKDSGKFIKAMR